MARFPRFRTTGPVHAWIRGNDRQAIFHSVGDRIYFHRCLVEARRCGVAVHAYVFMSNHIHILGSGAEPGSLSEMVQCMGRRYVPYFNFMYERTGTLWEGRFKSCPVDTERYFLVCHRYVESNPVRAGIVGDPWAFEWSSYRSNAFGHEDDLVTPHSLYMELGASEAERRAAYQGLFGQPLDERTLAAIRDAATSGWAIGGREFQDKLEELGGRPAAPRKPGRPRKSEGARENTGLR
jgi:putative transposase